MSREKGTPEKELQDAVKRFNREPEAKNYARDYEKWCTFLTDVIGVNPAAVKSTKGQSFWNTVADGICELNKPEVVKPTEDRGKFYINPETHRVSYRNKAGQWTSYKSVGLARRKRTPVHVGERVYTNPKTSQVSYRNAYGQWTKK